MQDLYQFVVTHPILAAIPVMIGVFMIAAVVVLRHISQNDGS